MKQLKRSSDELIIGCRFLGRPCSGERIEFNERKDHRYSSKHTNNNNNVDIKYIWCGRNEIGSCTNDAMMVAGSLQWLCSLGCLVGCNACAVVFLLPNGNWCLAQRREAKPICVVQLVIIFVIFFGLLSIFVGGCRWRISSQLCVAVVLVVIKVVLLLLEFSFFQIILLQFSAWSQRL